MKSNENKQIHGNRIILVPYEAKHVPRYHEWMKSEELQQLTASEPLTLDQEYEMQQSWRNDENKCTFIILSNEGCKSEIDSMVGDVNLFFNDDEDLSTAEVEIMVAEKTARGQGIGKEALLSMIRYGFEDLKLETVTAKIGFSNTPSLALFGKLGFREISKSDVFEEVTLELRLTEDIKETILEETKAFTVKPYATDTPKD